MVKKLLFANISLLLITLFGQLSIAQISINKPALGFTSICASPVFNNFSLTFVCGSISNVQVGNQFRAELSDANGSFANPLLLTVSTATTSPVTMTFQVPTTINGGAYKIRIKSTLPIATSPSSDAFPALYKPFEQGFKINNEIANQSFCENGTYNLSIDQGNSSTSPINFSQLTYIWFKNNVVIPSETGTSLLVTSAGNYYCKIDYGNCTSNSQSNIVTMTTVPAQILTISSPTSILCGTAGITMTSSLIAPSYTYEWYKDNVAIVNSNNATYLATSVGAYTCKITNNACITSSNSITLTTQDFSVSLSTGVITTIIPGQNSTLTVTTNALSPTYSWYKNNILQSGNQASFTTNQSGTYKVEVNQTTGCVSQKEATTVISYPTSYNLNIEHLISYTDCQNTNAILKVTSFFANSTLDVVASNVPINYQWYKNGASILGANTNTFSLNNFINNGEYELKATLTNGEIVTSNKFTVLLKFTEVVTITADRSLLCNAFPTVNITPNITNAQYTYTWYKVGNTTSLSNNQILNTSVEGDYYLKLSFQGCSVNSNTITISRLLASDLITSPDSTELVLSEGQNITITASGADSYVWLVTGQPNVTTPTFTVTEAGSISLVGTFGSCTVEKIFTVTANKKTSNLFIPNAITPNNDSSNDTWIIPEEFAYKDDIEIVIFTSRQEIVFQSKNYLNNWPISPVQDNSVYYYKIIKDSSVLEKGTISILK